jgi:hypothetical protein
MAPGRVTKRVPTRSSVRQKKAKAVGTVAIAHLAAALCPPAEERPSKQYPAPDNQAKRPLHQGVSSEPRQNPWLMGSSQMATGRCTPQTVAPRNSGQWLIQPEMMGTERACSRAEHQSMIIGTGTTNGADRDDTSPPWQLECSRNSISPTYSPAANRNGALILTPPATSSVQNSFLLSTAPIQMSMQDIFACAEM